MESQLPSYSDTTSSHDPSYDGSDLKSTAYPKDFQWRQERRNCEEYRKKLRECLSHHLPDWKTPNNDYQPPDDSEAVLGLPVGFEYLPGQMVTELEAMNLFLVSASFPKFPWY
jgi:hypothetical protein